MSSKVDLPNFDFAAQAHRIERLRADHPATTETRTIIRRFVESCALQALFKSPVLDVGCGYRSNEPEVCSAGSLEFFTLDADPRYRPDFQSDAREMNLFNSNTFGAVICTEVLEHVNQPRLVIAEAHRILRSGGYFVLSVPFWKPVHESRGMKDYWRFTPAGIAELLESFKPMNVKPSDDGGTPLCILAWGRKP